MPDNPIGVTFIPSAEQAQNGPRQGNLEGDLSQAFKVLSLHLPRVLGARAIAPPDLLNSQGASAVGSEASPQAAVFQALLQALLGHQMSQQGAGSVQHTLAGSGIVSPGYGPVPNAGDLTPPRIGIGVQPGEGQGGPPSIDKSGLSSQSPGYTAPTPIRDKYAYNRENTGQGFYS